MRKLTVVLAAGMIFGASGMAMAAGDTASDSANALANVITPISIVRNTDMAFGNLVAVNGGGTVVVPALPGNPNRGGTAALMPIVSGTVSAAKFTASGQSGYAYTLTLPTTGELTTGGAVPGFEVMGISDFTAKNLAGDAPGNLGEGSEEFYVGATLQVGSSQWAGIYVGSVNVAVNYN